MTKSKRIRLVGLASALLLGAISAYYRVRMALGGAELDYGGIGYSPGLLFVAIAVCLLALLIISVKFSGTIGADEPSGIVAKAVIAVSGLSFIAAAALFLSDASLSFINMVQMLFCAACGATLLIRSMASEHSSSSGLLSLFPVYYFCFALLRFYRANASNPSVLSFGIELCAVIFVTLAVYALASQKFEKWREWPKVFLCLAAIYFVSIEITCLELMPRLVMSVPGVSYGGLVSLCAAALYSCAGLFACPAAPKKADHKAHIPNPPDSGPPKEEPLTLSSIVADELVWRSGGEASADKSDEIGGIDITEVVESAEAGGELAE